MISVVLPALNESRAIGSTIAAFQQVLAEAALPYEILVVDDGSTDDTGAIAAAAGVTVIRHPHNVGYGRSIKDGITAAQHDIIVLSDADGTYPIDKVPQLVSLLSEGFDLVIGHRGNTDDFDHVLKRILRRGFRRFIQVVAGRKVPDVNSGLRVFRKSLILTYFPILCETFSFTTSQTLSYMLSGRFVSFVTVPYQWRQGESKVRLIRDSLRTLRFVVRTVLYYEPMRIFILFSVFLILLAVVSLVVSFLTRVNAAYFIALGSIMTAMIVFCLGLLADLLHHILSRLRVT